MINDMSGQENKENDDDDNELSKAFILLSGPSIL